MEYLVIQSSDLILFQETINKHLNDGWKLQGGVSVIKATDWLTFYAQAIYKESKT